VPEFVSLNWTGISQDAIQRRFTPGDRASGTHWVGGWVDLRAGLDDLEKRKFLTLPGLELRPSVVQPVASRYIDHF
jgi:hypothetical protein